VRVTREVAHPEPPARGAAGAQDPDSVVIVGGGPAADCAAEMLRRRGYRGSITLVSDDQSPPVDRPNLSKDYLAGDAPEEWIPLRPEGFYEENEIRLRLGCRVTDLDVAGRAVKLDDGTSLSYGALLLATGASPIRLSNDVDPLQRALYLRTLADSRAIIDAAKRAERALVLGASFIGLEVAASLRARGLEVHVAAPETRPLERILGPELGDFVKRLHDDKGIRFHLGRKAQTVDERGVVLDDGSRVDAELVVAGIGVRPRDELAARAGLATDKGIVVDAQLRTSAPGVFAAGDVARFPDPRTGQPIRVEHWVVAERMGQTAARNILGSDEAFIDVPFFWSRHYDQTIGYVGHAEKWDAIEVDGDLARQDCTVRYRANGKVLAVATVGRDCASLEAEAAMEKEASAQV
jgi:NADPH-dependent 2,4-dienoyl-CoA reductase/sulfur reductase-like enzyme